MKYTEPAHAKTIHQRQSYEREKRTMVSALRWLLPLSFLVPLFMASCRTGGGVGATATPTPKQRIDEAARAMQGVSAFHFLLTHQNGMSTIANGLEMTRAEGDFVAPDRFRAVVKASFQTFPVSVTVVSISDRAWITNPLQAGEHYQPLPNGPQTAEILDPSHGLLKAAEDMSDPRLSGSEKIGAVDTLIVAGNVDAGSLMAIATEAERGRQVPTQIWIGRDDAFVYRIRLNGPLSAAEPKNIVRQVDLSQFNEKVDISPPPR